MPGSFLSYRNTKTRLKPGHFAAPQHRHFIRQHRSVVAVVADQAKEQHPECVDVPSCDNRRKGGVLETFPAVPDGCG
ncbi:hypothetical protein [Palleronia caenipelagi]|uniref:Uncharacterized protein n=1 Tax=Palleronia caenipelagi TaxID=2489174 RepID=A0A547PMT3_9RHOB|nr:hypothetical protein [Palleronia caenipelagi]TRD15467.1 hypothetical protein FEV53_16260 [Palleronia caenipelagi]